jgi:hypothetical protein
VQPQIAQFNSDHALGFFTGNNLEATLESAEQGTDGQEIFVNGFRPITDAATVYGSVSWRQALNATPTARNRNCDASPNGQRQSAQGSALYPLQAAHSGCNELDLCGGHRA